jgi:hypothetical protein
MFRRGGLLRSGRIRAHQRRELKTAKQAEAARLRTQKVGGVNRAEAFEERKPSEKLKADRIAKGETLKEGGWASEPEAEKRGLLLIAGLVPERINARRGLAERSEGHPKGLCSGAVGSPRRATLTPDFALSFDRRRDRPAGKARCGLRAVLGRLYNDGLAP